MFASCHPWLVIHGLKKWPKTLLALRGLMLAVFVSACAGDGAGRSTQPAKAPFDVAITSSDLAVGEQRFAFVALENDNPINNETMYLRFFKVPAKGSPSLVGEGPIPWSPLSVQPAEQHKAPGHLDTEITGVY